MRSEYRYLLDIFLFETSFELLLRWSLTRSVEPSCKVLSHSIHIAIHLNDSIIVGSMQAINPVDANELCIVIRIHSILKQNSVRSLSRFRSPYALQALYCIVYFPR